MNHRILNHGGLQNRYDDLYVCDIEGRERDGDAWRRGAVGRDCERIFPAWMESFDSDLTFYVIDFCKPERPSIVSNLFSPLILGDCKRCTRRSMKGKAYFVSRVFFVGLRV